MSSIEIGGTALDSPLQQLLMADFIQPGSEPSYQLCKTIYTYHPMGKKLIDAPISLALSKAREISVPDSPEDLVTESFERQWKLMKCDKYIENVARLASIYGVATLAYDVTGINPDTDLPYKRSDIIPPDRLHELEIIFHTFDPMNTAGSLVLDQNPASKTFQTPVSVSVAGEAYHPSRCLVVMNEDPIYIQFTSSAFGFVGRSKYQRALFPLKSFIRSMITDDLVQDKAGLLVAKMKQAGSIVDNIMSKASNIKRQMLKDSRTGNVFSMGLEESVESINLTNIEGAVSITRKNIITNIATAAETPAQLLTQDSFAEGFGEGTEDAKAIAQFIDRVRMDMEESFEFMTKIVQRKAWTPDFYATLQQQMPAEYGAIDYMTAFYRWANSFIAKFPDLIDERKETILNSEKVKLDGIQGIVDKLVSHLDPQNKGVLLEWAAENVNELKMTFPNKLNFDMELLMAYDPQPVMQFGQTEQEQTEQEQAEQAQPFGSNEV